MRCQLIEYMRPPTAPATSFKNTMYKYFGLEGLLDADRIYIIIFFSLLRFQ